MEADRRPALVAALEVVALEHPRDGGLAGHADHVLQAEGAEPLAVTADLRRVPVEDLEHLIEVRGRVRLDLGRRQLWPRGGASAGIADPGGHVPDDQDRPVPEVLKFPQLGECHRVTEVDVGRRRVDAELDPQRSTGCEARPQLVLGVDAHDVARQPLVLLGGGHAATRSRTRTIDRARPVSSSTSICAPWMRTGPAATSNRTGIWLRNRYST